MYRHKDFGIHGGCDEWCRKTIGPFVYTSGTMAQISAAFRRTDPSSSLHAVSPPPSAVCKNNKKQLSAAHNRWEIAFEGFCVFNRFSLSLSSLIHTHNSTLFRTRHTLCHYTLSRTRTISPSHVCELTVGIIHRGESPQKSSVSLFCRKNRYRLL